jgi:hypothetical protein
MVPVKHSACNGIVLTSRGDPIQPAWTTHLIYIDRGENPGAFLKNAAQEYILCPSFIFRI